MKSLKIYEELKREIGRPEEVKSSILVLSVPGMGAGHLAKKYIEEYPEVKYVNGPGQDLGKNLTLMYLACDIDANVFKWADEYVRASSPNQNFVIFLNSPDLLETEKYKNSYLAGHVYKQVWLTVAGEEDSKNIALGYNSNLSADELEKINFLSGGLPQLIKYLSINKLIKDAGLDKILESIIVTISRCSDEMLEKMGLMVKGKILSGLIQESLSKSGGRQEPVKIKIDFDLMLEEDGKKTGEEVSLLEKQILEEMVLGNGRISKEKVSDIKWGEGKYDEYSDQAINKQMRRLSDKLKFYEIETIPKVGFRINKRSDTKGQ